jgi:hypothetical protein
MNTRYGNKHIIKAIDYTKYETQVGEISCF